jgi:hypothetical protein
LLLAEAALAAKRLELEDSASHPPAREELTMFLGLRQMIGSRSSIWFALQVAHHEQHFDGGSKGKRETGSNAPSTKPSVQFIYRLDSSVEV